MNSHIFGDKLCNKYHPFYISCPLYCRNSRTMNRTSSKWISDEYNSRLPIKTIYFRLVQNSSFPRIRPCIALAFHTACTNEHTFAIIQYLIVAWAGIKHPHPREIFKRFRKRRLAYSLIFVHFPWDLTRESAREYEAKSVFFPGSRLLLPALWSSRVACRVSCSLHGD